MILHISHAFAPCAATFRQDNFLPRKGIEGFWHHADGPMVWYGWWLDAWAAFRVGRERMSGLGSLGFSRRRLSTLFLLGVASDVAITPASGAEETSTARVVIHDGDEDLEKVVHSLENSINLNKYYAEHKKNVEIKVVFNGRAVSNFSTNNQEVSEKVAQFSERFPRIGLNLCGNSIKAMEQRDGRPFVADKGLVIVPSGAVMLVELQKRGWAYIRA